jgi:hypothetical protein
VYRDSYGLSLPSGAWLLNERCAHRTTVRDLMSSQALPVQRMGLDIKQIQGTALNLPCAAACCLRLSVCASGQGEIY